jgi:hypothetical protein
VPLALFFPLFVATAEPQLKTLHSIPALSHALSCFQISSVRNKKFKKIRK